MHHCNAACQLSLKDSWALHSSPTYIRCNKTNWEAWTSPCSIKQNFSAKQTETITRERIAISVFVTACKDNLARTSKKLDNAFINYILDDASAIWPELQKKLDNAFINYILDVFFKQKVVQARKFKLSQRSSKISHDTGQGVICLLCMTVSG